MNNHGKADSAVFTAYEDHKGVDGAESEKNLMRAILHQAMEDIKKGGDKSRDAGRYFIDARDDYLYSFVSICRHLELCAKTIRTVVGIIPLRAPEPESKDEDQIAA